MPRGVNTQDEGRIQGRNVVNANSSNIVAPGIVTDGLVLHLDAGNYESYPIAGTSWYDLSDRRNNGTLTNGPTYVRDGGGAISFDGTNDYASTNNSIGNFGNLDFTICLIFKTTTSTSAACFLAKSIGGNPATDYGWLVNHSSSGNLGFACATANVAWGGTGSYSIRTDGVAINDNNWKYVVIVANRGLADVAIYINNVSVSLGAYVGKASFTTLGDINNTQNLTIASESDAGGSPFHIAATIPVVKLYNRALTPTEVAQNFNALRSRFNI